MTRVRVDFNSRGAGGTVRGSQRRADGDLVVGAMVELYDPDEDMTFDARVVALNLSGAALFEPEWVPA